MKQFFALIALFAVVAFCSKAAPQWPQQYYVRGTFSIPYFEIVEPIEIYYDAVNNRELLSYYDGMDKYYYRYDIQMFYQVIPRIDQMKCFTMGNASGSLTTLLPDLSSWTYRGIRNKHHQTCEVWETMITNYNKTATYTMYLNSQTLNPVELHLNGYDFVFGSHPDIYIMRYLDYKPGYNDATIYTPPSLCSSAAPATENSLLRAKALLGRLGSVVPPSRLDNEFDHFMMLHKKSYADQHEYEYRRSVFEQNLQFIESHNARSDVTHKVAINHLADYTQDEVRAMLYPQPAGYDRIQASAGATRYHESVKSVPAQIDWVQLGAVNPPKDQGVCGSCWTFGTTGALEGAWFMKTGDLVSLSEQQIVDCAWGQWIQGNSGCDGGFAGPAFEWIMSNGGIALENTYKYLMQDHWCNAFDLSSGVTVTGYVNVTEGSESDLMNAVGSVGPVTVAIDASHPSFTYYTSGVYYEPTCGNTIDDLDHQVLVVGYGTENGQDYWLVKNSWSTHWGNKGYVKMSRNRGNNCGVATQAQYPLV